MITLTMFGHSLYAINLMSCPLSSISMPLFALNSGHPSPACRQTMGKNSIIMCSGLSFLLMASSFVSHVHTHRSKTGVPSVSCALSMTAFVPFCSTPPCPRRSGQKPSTLPLTHSIAVLAVHAMTPHPTSSSMVIRRPMTTCVCSGASATLTCQPPQLTNSRRAPPLASSWATLLTRRDTVATTQKLTA